MRERFAPSPTGFLHLGHAFSALTAWDAAEAERAEFLLRIEDIDTTRSRPEFEAAIFEDLHWLGLSWPEPVMRQSDRMDAYQEALKVLISNDLCYPCKCSRRDINLALSAPQEGDGRKIGPDGPVYPGTCRDRRMADRITGDAIRLNMARAIDHLGGVNVVNELEYLEIGGANRVHHRLNAKELISATGDIVLARRDIGTSYHLAVVVDDAAQAITHVTRGRDMESATAIHVLLQHQLGYKTPVYCHHRLIRDENGKRLAKRDDARAIRKYRADGLTPEEVRALVGLKQRLA